MSDGKALVLSNSKDDILSDEDSVESLPTPTNSPVISDLPDEDLESLAESVSNLNIGGKDKEIKRPVIPKKITPKMARSELDYYREIMYSPTSREDLEYMLDNQVHIVSYQELLTFNTLDDLLEDYGAAIILYPNAGTNVGHWCCIFFMPGTDIIQFFDPYGVYPDDQLDDFNYDSDTIHKRTQFPPKILELLLDTPYRVRYNEFPLQNLSLAANTCGLWCVFRLKNRSLTEEQFKKLFYDVPVNKNISPDLALSRLTSIVYPEYRPNL